MRRARLKTSFEHLFWLLLMCLWSRYHPLNFSSGSFLTFYKFLVKYDHDSLTKNHMGKYGILIQRSQVNVKRTKVKKNKRMILFMTATQFANAVLLSQVCTKFDMHGIVQNIVSFPLNVILPDQIVIVTLCFSCCLFVHMSKNIKSRFTWKGIKFKLSKLNWELNKYWILIFQQFET